MEERISEKQLVIPALKVISLNKQGVTTTELIEELENILCPKGKDAQIIPGRNDTFFSQKVRNLRSHETFERYGFAEYINNKYFITETGRTFLESKLEEYEYINTGYFKEKSQKKANEKLLDNDKNTFYLPEDEISEGKLTTTSVKARKRSAKLRQYALDYHKKRGDLYCSVCEFDFEKTYGELGKDYIEFHHIEPISVYEEDGKIKNLEEAKKNLVPLCSNCHKILHRNNIAWEELKSKLN